MCYCKGKEIQALELHGRILPCDKTHIVQKWVVLNIGHSFGLFRFDLSKMGMLILNFPVFKEYCLFTILKKDIFSFFGLKRTKSRI